MHLPDPGVQKVVKDELRALLSFPSPFSFPNPLPPASFENVCTVQQEHRDFREITPTRSLPDSFPSSPTHRRTDIWRTSDRRPVCFYCHIPGHIARYCNRRITDEMDRRRTRSPVRYSAASNPRQHSPDDRRYHPYNAVRYSASASPKTADIMRRHLFKIVVVEHRLPILAVPAQFLRSAMTLQRAAKSQTRGRSLHCYRRSGCSVR